MLADHLLTGIALYMASGHGSGAYLDPIVKTIEDVANVRLQYRTFFGNFHVHK